MLRKAQRYSADGQECRSCQLMGECPMGIQAAGHGGERIWNGGRGVNRILIPRCPWARQTVIAAARNLAPTGRSNQTDLISTVRLGSSWIVVCVSDDRLMPRLI